MILKFRSVFSITSLVSKIKTNKRSGNSKSCFIHKDQSVQSVSLKFGLSYIERTLLI